jgi:hypothetical protein
MNEIQKVVGDSRSISCNHSGKSTFDAKVMIAKKKLGDALETDQNTYEQIISRLTELVCLGVSE